LLLEHLIALEQACSAAPAPDMGGSGPRCHRDHHINGTERQRHAERGNVERVRGRTKAAAAMLGHAASRTLRSIARGASSDRSAREEGDA
jgi:hypothetical protein